MNKRKIDKKSEKDLIVLFQNLIPVKLLAEIFDANYATILKYIPTNLKEDYADFAETGSKQHLHLLQLYAWLVINEKECADSIGTALIISLKNPLYRFLHLKDWVQYFNGAISYKIISEKNNFSDTVTDGYKNLINDIFPVSFKDLKPALLLEDCLKKMHSQDFPFPAETDVHKPEKALETYILRYIAPKKLEYRYFDDIFIEQLRKKIYSYFSSREIQFLEAFYGISKTPVVDISLQYSISAERIRQIVKENIGRLQRFYQKYTVLRKTPGMYLEMEDRVSTSEWELKMHKESSERIITGMNKDLKKMAECVASRTDRSDVISIVQRIIPEEELNERAVLLKSLDVPVEDLDLSTRAYRCLKAAHINTLLELVQYEQEDLMKFRNFGTKSLSEIEVMLNGKELHFGMRI